MATLQEMIAASLAANPQAAGSNGLPFAYQGPTGVLPEVAASLAANPQASTGGYQGIGTAGTPGPAGQTDYFGGGAPAAGGSSLAQIIQGLRGGYTPDYQALLASDPQLLQAQADARGTLGGAAATRKAQTARILAQLGIVPDFAAAGNALGLDPGYLASDVDPTVQGLAKTMTEQGLSTEAQLGKQHEALTNNLVDMLAARGTLRSGGLGTGLTLENQRDKQGHFDALRTALDAIGGTQGAYNQVVQGTTGDLRTAGENAMNRQIQLHPAIAAGYVDAHYDPATGLYRDADGNFYNADGSATKPGAANASPVHPSNVAAPALTSENGQTTSAAAAAPVTVSENGASTPASSAAAAPAVPHATIPGAPPALVSEHGQGGGYTVPPVPAAAPQLISEHGQGQMTVPAPAVPVPRPYGNPVIDDAPRGLPTGQVGSDPGLAVGSWVTAPPAPKTAWSNSVTKRLNMGF